MKRDHDVPPTQLKVTIGEFLSIRLQECGIVDYFVVPGDYNLVLLDEIIKNKNLNLISCCNELNAGYAADGYARAKGIAAVFVTYFVGGLSLINAVAGAYSDDIPIIVVSGGPNSNDFGTNRILHHTLGIPNKTQQYEMYKQVTADAVIVTNAIDAPGLIDRAISTALKVRKPVYIEICCNIAQHQVNVPVPMAFKSIPDSNPSSLQHAVENVTKLWNESVKPVIVGGVKLRSSRAIEAFIAFATRAEAAVAVMPNAKSFFPEDHELFIGTYWGNVSSPFVCEIVESADLYVYVGPVFNDYTTTGYSTLVKKEKMIQILPDRVKTPVAEFGCVYMAQFLRALAASTTLEKKPKSLQAYKRIHLPDHIPPTPPTNEPLTTRSLVRTVQSILNQNSAVLVETGDSWFNGQKLKLPHGVPYEFQMQYGSIGWSVGAVLGQALAYRGVRRVVAMIGDGSFQMTAQEVATMIRYQTNPIIFLLNNRGYTIEVEIHDGPYNNIKNWDYKLLIDAFAARESDKVKSLLCNTYGELQEAVKFAAEHPEHLIFLECTLDRDDCSKELLEWGTRVASANGRAANVSDNY
jgi:pyruvate decarboxylase